MKKHTIQIPEAKAKKMLKAENKKIPYCGHAVKLKNGQILGYSPQREWFLHTWTLEPSKSSLKVGDVVVFTDDFAKKRGMSYEQWGLTGEIQKVKDERCLVMWDSQPPYSNWQNLSSLELGSR